MTSIIYIVLLLIINFLEFKKLDKITNDDLFYVLSLDTLSFSYFIFMFIYKEYALSIINIISIILMLYFYNKQKCSFFKTTLLLLNIYLIFKLILF